MKQLLLLYSKISHSKQHISTYGYPYDTHIMLTILHMIIYHMYSIVMYLSKLKPHTKSSGHQPDTICGILSQLFAFTNWLQAGIKFHGYPSSFQ